MNNPYRLSSDGRPMDVMEMYVDVFGVGRQPSYEQKKAVYEYIRRGYMEFVKRGPTRVEIRRKEVLRMLKLWRKFIAKDVDMTKKEKVLTIQKLMRKTDWDGKKKLKDFYNMEVSVNYFEIAQSVYAIDKEKFTLTIAKEIIKRWNRSSLQDLSEILGIGDVYDSNLESGQNAKNMAARILELSKTKSLKEIISVHESYGELEESKFFGLKFLYHDFIASNPNHIFTPNSCGNIRYTRDVQENYRPFYMMLLDKYDEMWNSTQTIDIDTILRGLVHNSSLRCGVGNPDKDNLFNTIWYSEKFFPLSVWESIYPLLGKDCEFTYNSFLYGFVNGISVYGIPVEDEIADDELMCPQKFLRHDIDHTATMNGKGISNEAFDDIHSYMEYYDYGFDNSEDIVVKYDSKSDMYSKREDIKRVYEYIHMNYEDQIEKEIMIYILWYMVHEMSILKFEVSPWSSFPTIVHLDMQRYGACFEKIIRRGYPEIVDEVLHSDRADNLFYRVIAKEFKRIYRKLNIMP